MQTLFKLVQQIDIRAESKFYENYDSCCCYLLWHSTWPLSPFECSLLAQEWRFLACLAFLSCPIQFSLFGCSWHKINFHFNSSKYYDKRNKSLFTLLQDCNSPKPSHHVGFVACLIFNLNSLQSWLIFALLLLAEHSLVLPTRSASHKVNFQANRSRSKWFWLKKMNSLLKM